MGEVAANKTHYMTFPHTLTGRTRTNFSLILTKNGEYITDIPVEIREVTPYHYTANFTNDGTDYSTWTLTISDEDVEDIYYVETWEVRKKTTEQTVKLIRSHMDSSGGFFGTAKGEE